MPLPEISFIRGLNGAEFRTALILQASFWLIHRLLLKDSALLEYVPSTFFNHPSYVDKSFWSCCKDVIEKPTLATIQRP
jgi:hypothetical protein